MSTTKPDPAAIGGRPAPAETAREHDLGCNLRPDHLGPCHVESKPSKLEETVEAEDLRAKLVAQGVQLSDDTSLDGLRELWATFGDGDPRAKELAAEIERKRINEETAEPERELEDDEPGDEDEPQPGDDTPEPFDLDAAADELTAQVAEAAGIATAEEARNLLAGDGDEEEPTVEALAARAQAAAGSAKTDPGTTTLFDAGNYDDPALALPAIDGHPIDKIAVQFSGEVFLDRANKDHVALWKRLKLGRSVELWVEAKGQGFQGKGATNRDGDLDVIVGKRTVSVQTVRILAPEELDGAAREIAAQAREADELEHALEQRELLEEASVDA